MHVYFIQRISLLCARSHSHVVCSKHACTQKQGVFGLPTPSMLASKGARGHRSSTSSVRTHEFVCADNHVCVRFACNLMQRHSYVNENVSCGFQADVLISVYSNNLCRAQKQAIVRPLTPWLLRKASEHICDEQVAGVPACVRKCSGEASLYMQNDKKFDLVLLDARNRVTLADREELS